MPSCLEQSQEYVGERLTLGQDFFLEHTVILADRVAVVFGCGAKDETVLFAVDLKTGARKNYSIGDMVKDPEIGKRGSLMMITVDVPDPASPIWRYH